MDRAGKLLFHSEHREMVGRSIHQRDENCQRCHTSFDYTEGILKGKQGTADYKLRDFPKRIAAFASLDFEGMSWVVVVNSAYNEVVAVTKKSLREHLALLGIVVLAAILGSVSIIRTDRFRVKAEEEVKHWREKRILEDKVQQSEALYRTIVENAHDAIWTVDTQGHFTFVNRMGEKISGYQVSELVGKDFEPLIPPEDLPGVKDLFLKILEGESNGADFEARFYAKDRKIRLLSVNAVPLYENGTVVGMFNIGRDITEQRNVEKALRESEEQLRYLSSQLLRAQETERRRISRELHDELGQALSVIKLRLSFIEKELRQDQGKAKEECETISQYINQVIENVRRLSRDLTPSILQDAGLLPAIHWLITNSKTNYKIKMVLDVGDIDQLFSQSAQIMIYRILQEALTNIGRHAQAKNASVMIKGYEDGISFSVEDDGVGFDPLRAATVNPNERGLGLAIMEERARMLGGSLQIWSEKGKGTRITFSVSFAKGGSA
jgi:PAS domain S-box-containing protein